MVPLFSDCEYSEILHVFCRTVHGSFGSILMNCTIFTWTSSTEWPLWPKWLGTGSASLFLLDRGASLGWAKYLIFLKYSQHLWVSPTYCMQHLLQDKRYIRLLLLQSTYCKQQYILLVIWLCTCFYLWKRGQYLQFMFMHFGTLSEGECSHLGGVFLLCTSTLALISRYARFLFL